MGKPLSSRSRVVPNLSTDPRAKKTVKLTGLLDEETRRLLAEETRNMMEAEGGVSPLSRGPSQLPTPRPVTPIPSAETLDPYAAVIQHAMDALANTAAGATKAVAAFPIYEASFSTGKWGSGVLKISTGREHIMSMVRATTYPGITAFAVILVPSDLPAEMEPPEADLLLDAQGD